MTLAVLLILLGWLGHGLAMAGQSVGILKDSTRLLSLALMPMLILARTCWYRALSRLLLLRLGWGTLSL
jgi:hypothetical protein